MGYFLLQKLNRDKMVFQEKSFIFSFLRDIL